MRLFSHLGRLAQLLAITALAGTALMTAAGVAQAAQGYGPVPPPGGIPGGYFTVITTQTIGPTGGTVGPVSSGPLAVTVHVPAGAFPFPLRVTLTAPNTAGIGSAGFPGFQAFGGVGVFIGHNGVKYRAAFGHPVTVSMASTSVASSDIAAVWNGSAFVRTGTVSSGVAVASFDSDPAFAVLRPTGGAILGGTSAVTGKPLLGEGLLAATLLLAGIGGLIHVRRRRNRASVSGH